MANVTIEFIAFSGKTLTGELYPFENSDVLSYSFAAVEYENNLSLYHGVVANPVPGNYYLHVINQAGGLIGEYKGLIKNVAGTYRFGESSDSEAAGNVDNRLPPDPADASDIAAEFAVTNALINQLALVTNTGEIPVDHNYGEADALQIILPNSAGVEGVDIAAYLQADYDAGRRSKDFVHGRTVTDALGRWRSVMMLAPGDYVLVVSKPGVIVGIVIELTVEE